jgi:Tol biopolymer transport system component
MSIPHWARPQWARRRGVLPRRPRRLPRAAPPAGAHAAPPLTRLASLALAVLGTAGLAAALLLVAFAPRRAEAQYFGQNRVRYDRFDARVLRTAHFDLHHDARAADAARDVARMAERWHARLSSALGGHAFAARKPLVLYTDHPDFQQTLIGGGGVSEGTRGFAEGARGRLVMPLAGLGAETDHVLGHEVVHLMQFDIAEREGGGVGRMLALPLWFVEGMAEYLSLGRDDPNTALWLRGALSRGRLPTVAQLSTDPTLFPYRYGHAFWAYVAGRYGDAAVDALFRASLTLGVEGGIGRALQTTGADLSAEWHAAITEAYAPALGSREFAETAGRAVMPDGGAAVMQLSPALSPDGSRVAFLTRHPLRGLDLVVADVATGRVERSIGGEAVDAHADALAFLHAPVAWHPDGRRLAHVVVRRGDHEIAVTDARTGRVVRRIAVRGVPAISGVAWSPDGGRLAVAGSRANGQPDLFVYDLAERTVQQVTDDRWAELQPAWSPDGRQIAVATDRGAARDLEALAFGRLRLALVDPVGGRARLLPVPAAVRGARMSDPQWSPDSRALYFVSDAGGVPDVFRVRVADGAVERLTRLITGVSGITERSPAITVARETGALLFTAFDGAGHRVFALDPARTAAAPAAVAAVDDEDALAVALARDARPVDGAEDGALGVLPPLAAPRGVVAEYLADPDGGLLGPTAGAVASVRYRPRLGLDGVGTPGIGVATGPLGAAVGGGASLLFGDLLATRRVALAVQAQGRVQDVGGQLLYVNQQTRWNWFASLARTPVVGATNAAGAGTVRVDGRDLPATIVQQAVIRTFLDQGSVGAQYPFSRTRRLELSVTGTRVSTSVDLRETALVNGVAVGARETSGAGGDGFAYAQSSLALVHDDARFGPVGPVAGGRWRLELGQSLGGLAHETVLADWRRYQALGRTTLALRGFHFGRYGRDAEDPRLPPLFLGEPQLVRGYQAGSFDLGECGPAAGRGGCPVVDRLVGSRVATAHVEWRVPLSGLRGWSVFGGGLPLELAPFVDAGVAWRAGERPEIDAGRLFRRDLTGLGRTPAVSSGLAARVHLGPVILETFWARPFQRERGGVFGFQLAPSW